MGALKPLSGIAFNDEMLRTRLEQGQTIAGNPMMFDEALGTVLDKKRKRYESRLENASFGEVYDPSEIKLSDSEYRKVIGDTAKKLRREIGGQSILKKLGYTLGAGVGDIAEDRTRSLYWLLNAPQAVTATLADLGVSRANPNLRSKRNIYSKSFIDAERAGLLRRVGNAPLEDSRLKIKTQKT
ncbi:hypothetical protein ACLM45_05760 [Synechococcus sp. A10-1-5-9]|uniref:hypothetical protein n=1 Tax=Synechococcus sp. A10-1-5-9 TaxID=3392295 RepID=UPI0039EA4AE1